MISRFLGVLLIVSLCSLAQAQTAAMQTADYVIAIEGGTITAYPRPNTALTKYSGTDASNVIQSAINALTIPGGGVGSAGGSIHINKGVYFLTGELTINGWENTINPFSQLMIEGDGFATQLVQNTPQKNAIVVKNCASFSFKNFRVYTGSNAASCLLADNNGTFTEWSCNKSAIDNVIFHSNSSSSAAVHLKNFFGLNVGFADIENTNNNALVLENSSASTNFGNSNFQSLRCVAGTASSYAGLLIKTSNPAKFVNMLTFGNYECISGYYGLYSDCLRFSTFNLLDIEGIARPVYFTGSAAGNETRNVIINNAYLYPAGGGAALTSTLYTAANQVTAYIEGDKSVTPLSDISRYRPPNTYALTFGPNVIPAKVIMASPLAIPYIFKKGDGSILQGAPGRSGSNPRH